MPAKVERLEANRYKLQISFADLPQGGFCRWRMQGVRVEVAPKSRPGLTVSLAGLDPDSSRIAGREPPDAPPEPVMATACHPGPPDDPNAIECKLIKRTVPDFYGDKKFVVNVAWDPKYEPPVEQYVPSEPWQPQ